MERYQGPVFGLIVRMVRDPGLAEDLSQETFIKAHRALSSYDRTRKFSSWLFKIAHNTAIDSLRRKKLKTVPLDQPIGEDQNATLGELIEDPDAFSPLRLAEGADLVTVLEEALALLPDEAREVVVLRFAEGLSYQEIAEVMDLPIGTVKTHIHRARQRLKRHFSALGLEGA